MTSNHPSELRRQVVELARSGTRVVVPADTFGMLAVSIYNWLRQDHIDRGAAAGRTTDQQLELAAAKRRIAQLETEFAVARKVNEVFRGPQGLGRVYFSTPTKPPDFRPSTPPKPGQSGPR